MNKVVNFCKAILLTFLILFNAAFLYAHEQKTLSFIVGAHASSNVTDVYFRFLEMAFAEKGYKLTLEKVPIKRAYQTVDKGIADGMVLLAKNILKTYKNIVLIPVPLTAIEIMGITNGRQLKIDGVKSLKPYKIGIIRGYTVAEKLTRGLNRQIVNDHDSLLSILKIGRVDIGFAMKRETLRFLKKNPQFDNITILEPPLVTIQLYPCLNKKYEAVVEQVTPVIERLIKEGVMEELYEPYRVH